jgi:hypothetical protein
MTDRLYRVSIAALILAAVAALIAWPVEIISWLAQ